LIGVTSLFDLEELLLLSWGFSRVAAGDRGVRRVDGGLNADGLRGGVCGGFDMACVVVVVKREGHPDQFSW
jgi:hypothetical protein